MANNPFWTRKGSGDYEGLQVPTRYVLVGNDVDSAAAAEVIEDNKHVINQFVEAQRRAYAVSAVQVHRASTITPDIAIAYQNIQGQETVRLTPYPTYPVTPPTVLESPQLPPPTVLITEVEVPSPIQSTLCLLVTYKNKVYAYDMSALPLLVRLDDHVFSTTPTQGVQGVQYQFGSLQVILAANTLYTTTDIVRGTKTQSDSSVINSDGQTIYLSNNLFTYVNGRFSAAGPGGFDGAIMVSADGRYYGQTPTPDINQQITQKLTAAQKLVPSPGSASYTQTHVYEYGSIEVYYTTFTNAYASDGSTDVYSITVTYPSIQDPKTTQPSVEILKYGFYLSGKVGDAVGELQEFGVAAAGIVYTAAAPEGYSNGPVKIGEPDGGSSFNTSLPLLNFTPGGGLDVVLSPVSYDATLDITQPEQVDDYQYHDYVIAKQQNFDTVVNNPSANYTDPTGNAAPPARVPYDSAYTYLPPGSYNQLVTSVFDVNPGNLLPNPVVNYEAYTSGQYNYAQYDQSSESIIVEPIYWTFSPSASTVATPGAAVIVNNTPTGNPIQFGINTPGYRLQTTDVEPLITYLNSVSAKAYWSLWEPGYLNNDGTGRSMPYPKAPSVVVKKATFTILGIECDQTPISDDNPQGPSGPVVSPIAFPPMVSGQPYYTKTTSSITEIITPYATYSFGLGAGFLGWLHVSTNAHYLQGYIIYANSIVNYYLYLDGNSFLDALAHDIAPGQDSSQIAQNITTIYMDVPLDSITAL